MDDRDGLAFVFVGVVPERRHAVASYYGGLTLPHPKLDAALLQRARARVA